MFDRQHEFRDPLHLVDHQKSVMPDEKPGIRHRGSTGGRIVQKTDDDIIAILCNQSRKSALAALASAVDDDHTRV